MLRMCQNCVSGNDSEKREGEVDLPDKGQTFQRTPDQGIGGCSALAGPINKIDPSAKTWERRWRTRYTEMKRGGTHREDTEPVYGDQSEASAQLIHMLGFIWAIHQRDNITPDCTSENFNMINYN